jgi:hypothetical protein
MYHVPLSTINASGLKLIDIGFDGIPLTAEKYNIDLMSYRHISPSGDGQLLNTMKAN